MPICEPRCAVLKHLKQARLPGNRDLAPQTPARGLRSVMNVAARLFLRTRMFATLFFLVSIILVSGRPWLQTVPHAAA